MQTPHSGRRSSAAPVRRFREPLWLAPLLVAALLVGLVSISTADSSSLYSAARSAANQLQAGQNAPFTCTPTGIDWGNLGHEEDPDAAPPAPPPTQPPAAPTEQPPVPATVTPAHDKGRGDDDDHRPPHPETTVTCRNNGHWPLALGLSIQNLPDVRVSPTSLTIPTQATGSATVRLAGGTPGRYTNGRLVVEGNGQTVIIPIQYCLKGRGVQCR